MLLRCKSLLRSDCGRLSVALRGFCIESLPAQPQSQVHKSEENRYDLVINGGGIVGLAFLLYLQSSPFLRNLKVLMLEHQADIPRLPLENLMNQERRLSNRVSSLTIASKRFFQKLNIWNSIEPYVKPISSMHVWSTSYTNGITFTPHKTSFIDNFISYDDHLEEDLQEVVCYVLENNILISALNRIIDSKAIRFSQKLNNIQSMGQRTLLTLGDGEEIETSLLVGSDGFTSFVRKASNLKQFSLDLNQDAIVGTIEISKQNFADSNDVAYQRFVPHIQSVLAILPLTENHASFVLSVPKEKSRAFMEMDDDAFVNLLNEALTRETIPEQNSLFSVLVASCDNLVNRFLPQGIVRALLPRVNPPQILSIDNDSRANFPLHFGTTIPRMVGKVTGSKDNRVVLIGDAAHRVHPLAGQGLNLGIGDVEVLGKCLEDSLSRGEDPFGDHPTAQEQLDRVLYAMERRRLCKLLPMMTAIQTMQPLFTYLPGNSFKLFNQLSFIKNEVVRFANST